MPKISINDINRIIVLHEEGYSQVNIANRVNCSRASVQKVVKKYNETGDVVAKKGRGIEGAMSSINYQTWWSEYSSLGVCFNKKG